MVRNDVRLSLSSESRFSLLIQYFIFFPEEVMLAEENRNPGPSALDGELAGMFFYSVLLHTINLKI